MLLLSQTNEKSLKALQERAEKTNSLLEMRDSKNLLLAVGTSIKAFHSLKDKRGRFLYVVRKKSVINERTNMMEDVILYDVKLDFYKGKKVCLYKNSFLQDQFDQKENYWAGHYEKWQKSESILKECNDIVINKVK